MTSENDGIMHFIVYTLLITTGFLTQRKCNTNVKAQSSNTATESSQHYCPTELLNIKCILKFLPNTVRGSVLFFAGLCVSHPPLHYPCNSLSFFLQTGPSQPTTFQHTDFIYFSLPFSFYIKTRIPKISDHTNGTHSSKHSSTSCTTILLSSFTSCVNPTQYKLAASCRLSLLLSYKKESVLLAASNKVVRQPTTYTYSMHLKHRKRQ